MKLNKEIKDRIDKYFENITAEELFDLAVKKYGFKINNDIYINNQSFEVVGQEFYYSNFFDNSVEVSDNDSMPFAA